MNQRRKNHSIPTPEQEVMAVSISLRRTVPRTSAGRGDPRVAEGRGEELVAECPAAPIQQFLFVLVIFVVY